MEGKIQQQLFKVRDLRKKTQFKIDDAYLNGYAKILGVYSTAVYNSLARHAEFESQRAFPSERLIAEEHNITDRSVRNAIKKLKLTNIINIQKERSNQGKWLNNVYILLDKSEWKKPEELKDLWKPIGIKKQKPEELKVSTRGMKSAIKDNTLRGITHIKDNTYSKNLELAKLLYKLIKKQNPAWYIKPNWDNWVSDIDKIHRVDKRTYEQIEWMIEWVQQDDFWKGNILSPSKLRKQFNNLVIKAKGQMDKQNNKVAIYGQTNY